MFSRARRERRRRHSSADATIGAAVASHALCRWGESQPWVVAVREPGARLPGLTFVIDCAELGSRTAWFGIGPSEGVADDDREVIVVLPKSIAGECASQGWAVAIASLAGDRSVVRVPLPATIGELQVLEGLLQVAYCAAFRRVGPLV